MEEKELNAILEKVKTESQAAVAKAISDASNAMMKLEDFEKKMAEAGIEKDTLSKLTQAVEAQGASLRELTEAGKKGIVKSIPEILKENMEKMKGIAGDRGRKVQFIVPKTTVATSSITSDGGSYRLPEFNDTGIAPATIEAAWRQYGIVQDIPADSHGVISYTDLTTRTNNAAATDEASVYPENVYAWTGYTKTIEKVIASIPVTYEALTDIPQMEATLRRLITADLNDKLEAQLATGTGSAPQVNGIYTSAQTASVSGTTFTNSSPSIYDLLMWMKNYVVTNYGSKFNPNVALLNNGDALMAKWVKDELGNYVRNPFLSPDGMMINGMQIVETPKITANTALVGDMRFSTLYIGNGVEIEIGLDGNDFTYDLFTIKARRRLCIVTPTPDTYGFLKSTSISTDKTYLTSGE